MKKQLHDLFQQAVEQLKTEGLVPAGHTVELKFERSRQKEHGDFATNVALTLAKPARSNPRVIAEKIVAAIPQNPLVTRLEIAGPGFINVFVAQQARYAVLGEVFSQAERYGLAPAGSGLKIQVEFVSANPTGPLHVGHGRGAAYGDTLSRLLSAAGHQVEREYYVNDAGRQMDILAASVWFRYAQQSGSRIDLPDNCYKGDYVTDMGRQLAQEYGAQHVLAEQQIEQARQGLDDEAALDATIALLKRELGEEAFAKFFDRALDAILDDIRDDLSGFGVDYDSWFSERSLFTDGKIEQCIEQLKESGHLYDKGGAWWFRSTEFGDEKDRVVVRDNGQPTYFASDIAYHKDKLDRGFDQCINIWGSDHHGYIPRVKAALQALGLEPDKLTVLLVQFAVLYRGGEKISMSTRSGQFVTLRELREEVTGDAARFFYVQRKSEQHMDFDLDLAKSQSKDNPMYYVQYAHARIHSIFKQAKQRDIDLGDYQNSDFALLDGDRENSLMTLLQRFPELVQNAASQYEPHQVTYYLRDLATAFHSWYDGSEEKFLDKEPAERAAVIALSAATRQVLANGLEIIGVSAPETM